MRILLIHPGHSHSTGDVANGYYNALRELGHTVHKYNYQNALAFYGKSLDYWESQNPNFLRRDQDFLVLASERVLVEAVDFVPDVVLIICGLALHRRAYDLLNRLALPLALILTESPYADEVQGAIVQKGNIAATFANDKMSVEPLQALTDKEVVYLPHSFDPARHYRQRVRDEYKSDVYFFGTLWPERAAMLEPLRHAQNGYNFNLGGIKPITETPEGLTDNSVLALHYNGAKIALNHHRTVMGTDNDNLVTHIKPGAAWSLGPRAYEIAACGAFQLCDNTRPELTAVFGDSVATYSDSESLADQVLYYLSHEAERLEMARASHERVQSCTFINRARDIVIPTLERIRN